MPNQIEIGVIFEADVSDAAKAKNAAVDLGKSVQRVQAQNKQFSASSKSAMAAAASGAERAQSSVRELGGEYERLQDRIEAARVAASKDFDSTRQRVGIAGDFGSAAATISSITGIQGIGVAGEVAELAEALPLLKQAAAGLPSTIIAAATSLGPVGIAVTTTLAIVAVALGELANEAERQKQRLGAFLDAEREVALAAANGIPLEEARRRVAELENTLQVNEDLLAKNEQRLDETFKKLQDSVPVFGDFFARILSFLGIGELGEYQETVEELRKEVTETVPEIDQWNKAINTGKFAASEAAEQISGAAKAQDTYSEAITRAQQDAGRQQVQIVRDSTAQETALKAQAAAAQVETAQRAAQAVTAAFQTNKQFSASSSGSFIRRLNPDFNLAAFTGAGRSDNRSISNQFIVNGAQDPQTVVSMIDRRLAQTIGRS